MAKKPKKQRQDRADRQHHNAASQGSNNVAPSLLYAGLAMLLVAIFASGALVYQHFAGSSLPGCGPGSPCAAATSSVWGSVPFINWPVSFLGLAYFVGLGAAWLAVPRAGFGLLPWIVRLGAAFSILYIGVMLVENMLCPYCIASHAANLAFLVVLETARSHVARQHGASALSAPVQRLGIGFVAASVVLGGWQLQTSKRVEQQAQQDLEESTAAIVADAENRNASSNHDQGFTGRYVYGPREAPIRLVMFTSYQCVDCQRIERDVEQLLATRDDVSLSIKHYPMGTDCNPHITRDMHPNSCWAARAVEAAGILRGNDGFWQMHKWVFSRRGNFTRDELIQGLQQMGYTNLQQFLSLMTGDQTLALVQEDIEEGRNLGLMYTPMIFINGVELRGWTTPNAVAQAVARVAATNPQPQSVDEQPPGAFEKYVDDWRKGNNRFFRRFETNRTRGPANARLRIVLFGDYEEERVAETHFRLQELTADHDSVQYTFRHYPANEACNHRMTRTVYDNSCWAHHAAEAVAILYGPEGFWRMHEWLLSNQSSFNDDAFRAAAPILGFDAEEIFNMMSTQQVQEGLRIDIDEAHMQSLRGVPMLFINERWLPRWNLEGHDVLATVIEEAGR